MTVVRFVDVSVAKFRALIFIFFFYFYLTWFYTYIYNKLVYQLVSLLYTRYVAYIISGIYRETNGRNRRAFEFICLRTFLFQRLNKKISRYNWYGCTLNTFLFPLYCFFFSLFFKKLFLLSPRKEARKILLTSSLVFLTGCYIVYNYCFFFYVPRVKVILEWI